MSDEEADTQQNKLQPIMNSQQPMKYMCIPSVRLRDVEASLETLNGEKDRNVDDFIESFDHTTTVFCWNETQKYIYMQKMLKASCRIRH